MRAAQIDAYSGPVVINEVDKPLPGADQVLVEVFAASVNPFDAKLRHGQYKDYIHLKFPAILGGDVAGLVAAVGETVSGFKVGQAVYGQAKAASGHGSLAEFTLVPANQLALKPEPLDFNNAASLPLVAVSAYQALVDHMELSTGQQILIHGGAGGIGSLAIQIATSRGAEVAATASGKDLDFVKGLGANLVIDYKQQDFRQIIHDFDAVYDTIGGETNTRSYAVLKPNGILVSMLEAPDDKLIAAHHIRYVEQNTKVTPDRLAAISDLVMAGKLKVTIDKVFPLEEAGEALDYLQSAHSRGKVVVSIKSS